MSLRFALEGLNPAMRAQAEAKLRQGATIRGTIDAKHEKAKPTPTHSAISKYRAQKCEYDGRKFDSLKEMERYKDLLLMQKAGEIEGLELQKKYRLEIGGIHVCDYIADFAYWRWKDNERGHVVEDVKGYRSGNSYRVFRLKAKLMLAIHGINVEEA